MKTYRIDVPVWATAYVRAESAEAALEALRQENGNVLAVGENSLLEPSIRFSDVATIYTAGEFGEGVPQEPEELDDEEGPSFPELVSDDEA